METYTVKITFIPSDIGRQQPTEETYVKIPLGLPLPHAGDSIELDGTLYTVKSRALMLSDDVDRSAFWNLLVESNP